MRSFNTLLLSLLVSASVFAEHDASDNHHSVERESQSTSHHHAADKETGTIGSHHGRNHLSVLIGDTHVNGEGNSFTLGIDYEYRVSDLFGAGVVIERAYGELEATTFLAVADVHLTQKCIMQIGPGFERRHWNQANFRVPSPIS